MKNVATGLWVGAVVGMVLAAWIWRYSEGEETFAIVLGLTSLVMVWTAVVVEYLREP